MKFKNGSENMGWKLLNHETNHSKSRRFEPSGKNKRHTKKLNEGENMNALIQALTKQLDVKDQQLSVKDQLIQEMMKIVAKVANGEPVSQAEARVKLELVKS